MAILAFLTASSGYSLLFQRRILANLAYWQGYVAAHTSDPAALDRELERILNALRYGLEHQPAWPVAYELIRDFAPHMERRGHWDNWNRILTQAIDVAEQSQEQEQDLDLSGLLARLLYRQSRFKESVAVYRRVIRLAQQLDRKYDEARACTNLGFYYVEQGRFYRAEVLCCRALAIFEQIDSQHGLAHTYNHLGALYTRQGNWTQAYDHLDRACTIWQTMGDEHGLMRGLSNLGYLFNEMKRPYEAIYHLKQALKYGSRVKEEVITGLIHMNLGIAHRLQGDLVQAEQHCWQAEAILQRFSSLTNLADVQENLGLIYLDRQNWLEANLHFEKALKIWRMLGNQYDEIRMLLRFVQYELSKGNISAASNRFGAVEHLFQQYDSEGYHELQQDLKEIRRSLTVKRES